MGDRDKTPPLTAAARARSQADQSRPTLMIPVNEDDDTERRDRRAVTHWGDDERALAGVAHRGVSTDSQRRRAAAAGETTDGVPYESEDWSGDVTSPQAMLDAEISDADRGRMRRPTDTPANVGQVLNVAKAVNRRFAANRAAITAVASQVMELAASAAPAQIDALNTRIDGIEKTLDGKDGIDARLGRVEGKWKLVSAIVAFAVTGSGFTLAYISKAVLDQAERKGADAIRLINVETTVNELRVDLKQALLSIRYTPALPSWLQPPTKDSKP